MNLGDDLKEVTRESKVSDSKSGGRINARALQGLDIDTIKALTDRLPMINSLLDEVSKLGGFAIISLLRDQISELQR